MYQSVRSTTLFGVDIRAQRVSHSPWCTDHSVAEGSALSCCGSVKLRVPTQSRSLDDWLEPRYATIALVQEDDRPTRIMLDVYSGDELDLIDAETFARQLLKLVEVARRG